ncbi:MAG: NUDIX domain-containing protein [Pirellulaceae bacterium]|nr:NUDIX domain-containing protein [Pirellulaceae bacterium]
MIRVLAICLFRRGDEILVTEGLDTISNQRYARPLGGGIELGETSEQTIVRELREELGAEVRDLKLLGVLENLFELEGRQQHEVVFVYDGQFVDRSLYEQAEIPLLDGGWRTGAIWRPFAWFDEHCPLVPVGIEKLVG